jgi:hypothetical protein
MQFTINTVTRCTGLNHIRIAVTLGNGQTGTINTDVDELAKEPPESVTDAKDKMLDRIRSAIREGNMNNFTQIKSGLEGDTYKV